MLTESQAFHIVQASLDKTVGNTKALPQQTLQDVRITLENLNSLVTTLAADPQNGVPHFEHYLDPNIIGQLKPDTTTVGDLIGEVMRLSAGKLCSNPNTPHEQAYPYPSACPTCGYAVI